MKIFSYNRVNDINLKTEKMWFQYPIIKANNNRTAAKYVNQHKTSTTAHQEHTQ